MKKFFLSSIIIFALGMFLSIGASAKVVTQVFHMKAGCCDVTITVQMDDVNHFGTVRLKGSGCCGFDLSGGWSMPAEGGGGEIETWDDFEIMYSYSGDDFGEYKDEALEAFNDFISDL